MLFRTHIYLITAHGAFFIEALEPNMQKYLRILKTNFQSQHANKNNKVLVSAGGWLHPEWQVLKTHPFWMAAKGDGKSDGGGCTHKLSKRHSMPVADSRPTSNNLENMLRRVLRVARSPGCEPTKMRASLGGCRDLGVLSRSALVWLWAVAAQTKAKSYAENDIFHY